MNEVDRLMTNGKGYYKGADASAAPGRAPAPAAEPDMEHTRIKGRFNQFTSGYWALTLPLLSARYVAEGLSALLKIPEKLKNVGHGKWGERAWALTVGTAMIGVTSFYMGRTYRDMKNMFADAVGWEFGKKREDVGLADILKSDNALVKDARKNFIKLNTRRFAMHLPFFSFLLPGPFQQLTPKDSVNLGVGANALYLATDALGRKGTFFEELQNFIDRKINHTDRVGETISGLDLMNLYEREARTGRTMQLSQMGTPEWRNDEILFNRMADLMNQTYKNTPKTEMADFTVPKLIYLLGEGMLKSEDSKKNLAYIEVANRYGIPAVNEITNALKGGVPLDTVLERFPVPLPKELSGPAPSPAPVVDISSSAQYQENQKESVSFVNKYAAEKRPVTAIPAPPVNYVDKTAPKADGLAATPTA